MAELKICVLTDHGPVVGGHDLLSAGGQLHPGLLGVWIVGDDGGIVAGGPGQTTAVTSLLLQVAHNGTFRHGADGNNIANVERRLLAAVHELTGVHALGCDEQLLTGLKPVGVAEVHHRQRRAAAGVVNNILRREKFKLEPQRPTLKTCISGSKKDFLLFTFKSRGEISLLQM
jgi:hypothetical protein